MNKYTKITIGNNLQNEAIGKILDLSCESLTTSDYEWLTTIITRAAFLEEIYLPYIPKNKLQNILALLEIATIKNSTLIVLQFDRLNQSDLLGKEHFSIYQKIQLRLIRNKKRIFAIHGGGNIGLGLMADILAKSKYQYQIIATSNHYLLSKLINSVHKLWLQHHFTDVNDTTCINRISIISRNEQDIMKLYSEACLAAICVTPNVLTIIAKTIAKALINRFENDGSGLKILVLMNVTDCAKFVAEQITAQILLITQDEQYTQKILSGIEFIPTVIDRIVTQIDDQSIKQQLKMQLKNVDQFTDDAIENILSNTDQLAEVVASLSLQFNLFHVEKNFSVYVPDSFIEAYRLPAIKMTKNLQQIEAIKNKYINGPHVILAWIGALLGCTSIAESIQNPAVFTLIKELMEKEIGPILAAEYPEIAKDEFEALENSFFERCFASVNDPVTRVGRDPLRKLNSGGRIRGTIELAQKHNLRISTMRLEQGIAAGLLYAVKGIDANNPGCQKIKELYKKNDNSFSAILCYHGTGPSGKFSGFHPTDDKFVIDRILNEIDKLDHQLKIHHQQHPVRSYGAAKNSVEKKIVYKAFFTPFNSLFFNYSSRSYKLKMAKNLNANSFLLNNPFLHKDVVIYSKFKYAFKLENETNTKTHFSESKMCLTYK